MKYIFFFLLSLLTCNQLSSQNLSESKLRQKLDSIKLLNSDSAKLVQMQYFEIELINYLKTPETYAQAFDSLKNIGFVKSPDNNFRIISWNLLIDDGKTINFAVIQLKPEKNQACQVIKLVDSTDIDSIGNKKLNSKNWYGAQYYKIIPAKFNGRLYYTLLGLDSFSPFVSKKVIDILYFNNGEAYFGAPLFKVGGRTQNRMIFSFSARVSMMLNYDENIKTIVFDHLAPSESRYTGQFSYYGPDFSFDGFSYSKTNWSFIEDVKPNRPARNQNSRPLK